MPIVAIVTRGAIWAKGGAVGLHEETFLYNVPCEKPGINVKCAMPRDAYSGRRCILTHTSGENRHSDLISTGGKAKYMNENPYRRFCTLHLRKYFGKIFTDP